MTRKDSEILECDAARKDARSATAANGGGGGGGGGCDGDGNGNGHEDAEGAEEASAKQAAAKQAATKPAKGTGKEQAGLGKKK